MHIQLLVVDILLPVSSQADDQAVALPSSGRAPTRKREYNHPTLLANWFSRLPQPTICCLIVFSPAATRPLFELNRLFLRPIGLQ